MKNEKTTVKELKKILRNQTSLNGLSNSANNHIILIIFPRVDGEVNDYFNKVLGYITPLETQKRLHIDPAKFGELQVLIGGPCDPAATPPNTNGTAGTWNYVYPLEKDKSTFTHPLQKAKVKLIQEIKAKILDIYTDIPDSVITETDTLALGIKPKADRKKRTAIPPKITETVVIGLTPLGGGNVEVMVRTSKDAKRASKLNTSVDIEIAYSLVAKGEVAPASSKLCANKQVITKSRYLLELGEDAQGTKLVLFARWIYVSHETQSGAFGSAATCTVS